MAPLASLWSRLKAQMLQDFNNLFGGKYWKFRHQIAISKLAVNFSLAVRLSSISPSKLSSFAFSI